MTCNQLAWLIILILCVLAIPKAPVLLIPVGLVAAVFVGNWLFSLI